TSRASIATVRGAVRANGSAGSGSRSCAARSTIIPPGAPACRRPGTCANVSNGARSRCGQTNCRPTRRNTATLSFILPRKGTVLSSTYRGSGTELSGIGEGEMSKLQLSVAVGDYDRVRPLVDGTVAIDGVDPTFMTLVPEEIFFRAFRHAEFDICELSLSSFT